MEYSLRIDTTQNVGINFQLASAGERSLAWGIDMLLKIMWVLLIIEIFKYQFNGFLAIIASMIMVLPPMFYTLLCELFFNGQSLGKVICKTRVMKVDGSQPTLGSYLMRWVFGLLEFNMFAGLGLIIYFWNGKGQRLGDIFAGTTVVKITKEISLEDTTFQQVPEGYEPSFPLSANLSAHDIEVIKEGIAYYLTYKNYEVLNLLAHKVAHTVSATTTLSQLDFLQTVVSDHNYYLQKEG